jgi:hypothetical protein
MADPQKNSKVEPGGSTRMSAPFIQRVMHFLNNLLGGLNFVEVSLGETHRFKRLVFQDSVLE